MPLWHNHGCYGTAPSRIRLTGLGSHETALRRKYVPGIDTTSSRLTFYEAVVEHENVGTTVVTALCDIADSLPRVELATSLYPTDTMQQAVALLYAHIVRFLIRALEWFEEGKLAHTLHSITRPASLRYDDLIKEIQRDTQSITSHAVASSQVEQRDMHNEIRAIRNLADVAVVRNQNEQQDLRNKLCALTAMVVQLRESIAFDQSVNASARIEFRNTLTEIQLTQALAIISSHCNIDHKSNLRASIFLRDRHRFTFRSKNACFWTSPKLRDWNSSSVSSTILLKATFRERLEVRDFCTNVIEQLFDSRVATLWILRDRVQDYSLIEVLKSLILQALSLDYSSHTDVAFSFQLRKFLDARSDMDFLNLLGDILQHFKLVHIIADAEAMSPDAGAQCRVYLHRLSQRLSERGAQTVVKIIVSSCGPGQQSAQQSVEDVVLRLGKTFPRRNRKVSRENFRMASNLTCSSARPRQSGQRIPTGPARQRIARYPQ